jgi:hypothetical protein
MWVLRRRDEVEWSEVEVEAELAYKVGLKAGGYIVLFG